MFYQEGTELATCCIRRALHLLLTYLVYQEGVIRHEAQTELGHVAKVAHLVPVIGVAGSVEGVAA